MSTSLLVTKDNSHTVYSEKYKAHYHSLFGSVEESTHVFISAGLYKTYRKGLEHISIFEMGFGTGLNAFLTLLDAEHLKLSINYDSIESDPLDKSITQDLNYDYLLSTNKSEDRLSQLHTSAWNQEISIGAQFKLRKLRGLIDEHQFDRTYDLIYYDAFAPSSQPELWTENIHRPLYEALNPGGILVTYCTQGAFRRMLQGLGYGVERLNGPGKKREMLRATKSK